MWILLNILLLSIVSGYILVKKERGWADAQAHCEDKYGTHLATIRNDKDAAALIALTQCNVSPHPFLDSLHGVWIGLNDRAKEGHWIFSDGTGCPTAADSCHGLKYWRPTQPNALNADQNCAEILQKDNAVNIGGNPITINNMLNDWDCDFEQYFICDCPCRVAGFNLRKQHYCECSSSCGEDICNSFEFVRGALGESKPEGDLCPDHDDIQDPVCCCSCPNCPGYSDLFEM
eukprot:187839_1